MGLGPVAAPTGVDSGRLFDANVEEFEEEGAVDLAADDSVRFDDVLDVMLDEVIVGVDMLFDQA